VVKVSVCIITYNHEKYIEEAVKSVLQQDVNFEYEIVVGEDCSTDSTASILRELERKNRNRIKVIYRPANLGGIANLSNTLSVCNGEYVAFLEGDDYWASNNKLQCQVDFLNNNRGAGCVFHRTRVISESAEWAEGVVPNVDPPELFSLDFLFRNNINQFSASSLLARRACLRNIDAWLASGRPGDWALYMMLATQGDLGFIPLEMSYRRLHAAGSWTRLSSTHSAALVTRMLMHVMGLVSGKDQELVKSAKSHWADVWSSELVAKTSVSIEAVTNELNEIADIRLSNYLLAQVVAVARAKGHAQQWHVNQAKAWEAAAARAKQDASEALSVNQQLWSTIHGQRDRIAELESIDNRSQSTIDEQQARFTELQIENERFRRLINKYVCDSRRIGWLLNRIGEKLRHFPRDMSRRVRASRKKRRQSIVPGTRD
jgi:glycosyltransferase involved in cell wall biosynthesis